MTCPAVGEAAGLSDEQLSRFTLRTCVSKNCSIPPTFRSSLRRLALAEGLVRFIVLPALRSSGIGGKGSSAASDSE